MDVRQVFDDLVRFETELWNAVDATLLDECGISLGAYNTLLVLSRTPGCRVNDLAAALSITVGGASQAVDRFEAQGLVERVPNPANRRSSLLRTTDTGQQAFEAAGAVFDRELAVWLSAPLSTAAGARFARDLATLRAAAARRRSEP